ncbi:MAG: outer membrane beta-barrel protein [Bryobacteraceae bacterium]
MKRTLLTFGLLALAAPVWAQKHELAFTLGSTANDLKTALNVRTTSGRALQVNYGYRFWGNDAVAVSGELHFLANPQRQVSGPSFLTRDFASLYLTPGVRVKLNPKGLLQPYGVIGGGYALYEQSTTTLGGGPNPAPRHLTRGAFQYGGGLDIKVAKWLALRGEVRDFYTGIPALNLAGLRGGVHNVVASGGFVLRFGE